MTEILWFADNDSEDINLVGGKGANLARLARAGFPVPGGFTITTGAYRTFLAGSGLADQIKQIVSGIDYADPDKLEAATARIRDLICATDLPPELTGPIRAAYELLGSDSYVAVRSSGAAEDLEGASFAGLHDTYLDIRGHEGLLDAVRRCWASLWTARATSYRSTKGFDHFESPIALVVQTMVESEVSGVVFTANPINEATDEIVVNASWGLGEAIVGGITTPDEFVLHHDTLRIIERRLGEKEVRVVRDPSTGVGTVTEETDPASRARWSLTDAQVADLAQICRRIQTAYDGFPCDIEWCLAGGEVYIVQCRPITGVNFSWDADVTASVPGKDNEDQEIWSRAWADDIWTGAVTPLMFTWRGLANTSGSTRVYTDYGRPDFGYKSRRLYKYYKGIVYNNPYQDREFIEATLPSALRTPLLGRLPVDWHEDVLKSPFSLLKYLKGHLRYHVVNFEHGLKWTHTLEKVVATQADKLDGASDDQLRRMSDRELKRYIDEMIAIETEFYDVVIYGLLYLMRDTLTLLGVMLATWYDGDNTGAFADVLTGCREPTPTFRENVALWQLAQRIRNSPTLSATFREHEGAAFFERLADTDEGRAFRADYDAFLADHGHRGHDDRDIYYSRRAEDPGVDYRAFISIVSADTVDPEVKEKEVSAHREAVIDEIAENLRRKPFGALRVEAFKILVSYAHRCLAARDSERQFVDRSTFAIKKGFLEVNRRLRERGYFTSERDFYFLTMPELYSLFDGGPETRLIRAKIDSRMRNFDLAYNRDATLPFFLQRGRAAALDAAPLHGDGVFRGVGTSRGTVTGTARVVKTLKEIGRIKEGEILVTNSTDPGWTPAFLLIKGIVLETGGLLAHGALLAREFGFPGVQIASALQHIPDGATISLDGDAGIVVLESTPDTSDPRADDLVPA